MTPRPSVAAIALCVLLAPALGAPVARGEDAGPIEDNSFLVEEAYNQEPRIVQHIATWMGLRAGQLWEASFTQEWPVASQRHQLSYTIPVLSLPEAVGSVSGIGDVAIHYRFQWLGVGGGSVAFAPRVSVLLPTGDLDRGFGAAAAGVQLNLPLSTTVSPRWVTHTNAGVTLVREGETPAAVPPNVVPGTRGFNLGQSVIWLANPRLNLMLELAWDRAESVGVPGDADLEESLLLSPGLRWSHDFANGLQIVPGLAFPMGLGPSRDQRWIFLYLSFEHGI